MPKATAGTSRMVKWTRRKLCTTQYTRNSLCNPLIGCFGIHIGLSSKGRTFSAQGTKERFGMIGMDISLFNSTSCLRMFLPWALIFGSLSPFLMCLCTFILHPDVHTSFESLLGSSWFSIFYKFIAYLKEQISITALTICKDTQVMSLSRNLVQCLYSLFKEFAILLATI